jgi:hypothetical protein
VSSVRELPGALWRLRASGGGRHLSLLFNDPEFPLPEDIELDVP